MIFSSLLNCVQENKERHDLLHPSRFASPLTECSSSVTSFTVICLSLFDHDFHVFYANKQALSMIKYLHTSYHTRDLYKSIHSSIYFSEATKERNMVDN